MTHAQQLTDPADPRILQGCALLTPQEHETLSFLLPLSGDYPGFELWYRSKVIPGLRSGTRTVIRLDRRGHLIGVGIGKRDETERKICTVRIDKSYFGRGLGIRLFDSLLRWLETDKPHLTISEPKLPTFQRIFDYYSFNITSTQLGRYVPQVTEYAYNEIRQARPPHGRS
jgi:hypothetical protein